MAFNSIPSAWIASGKFAVQSLWQYIKDNFDYLYAAVTGSSATGLVNGSFELDVDSDNVPDNWTWNAYTGGTLAIETTDPGHGAKGIKITSPGGSGNGGGYLTSSSYVECSEYGRLTVSWYMKSSVADILNKVQVFWYKKDQTPCTSASTDLYSDATANPTSWTRYQASAVPPADARYYKIRLTGAHSDDTTAGNCMFDGVSVVFDKYANVVAGDMMTVTAGTERSTTSASYTKVKEVTVNRTGTWSTSFTLKQSGGTTAYGRIYRNGVAVGTERSESGTDYVTYSEDITGWLNGDKLQLYLKVQTGGFYAYSGTMIVGCEDPDYATVDTA